MVLNDWKEIFIVNTLLNRNVEQYAAGWISEKNTADPNEKAACGLKKEEETIR